MLRVEEVLVRRSFHDVLRTPAEEVGGERVLASITGKASVEPMRTSCKKVLYLEMVVGWTSADGREKSQ